MTHSYIGFQLKLEFLNLTITSSICRTLRLQSGTNRFELGTVSSTQLVHALLALSFQGVELVGVRG